MHTEEQWKRNTLLHLYISTWTIVGARSSPTSRTALGIRKLSFLNIEDAIKVEAISIEMRPWWKPRPSALV